MIEQLLSALERIRQEQSGSSKWVKKLTSEAWKITHSMLSQKRLVDAPVGILSHNGTFTFVDGSEFEDESAFLSGVQEHLNDCGGAEFVVLAQTGFIAMGQDGPVPIVSIVVKTPTEMFGQFAPVDITSDGCVMLGEIQTPPLEALMPYADIEIIHWSLQ